MSSIHAKDVERYEFNELCIIQRLTIAQILEEGKAFELGE